MNENMDKKKPKHNPYLIPVVCSVFIDIVGLLFKTGWRRTNKHEAIFDNFISNIVFKRKAWIDFEVL